MTAATAAKTRTSLMLSKLSIDVMLAALNDRETVLAAAWEAAHSKDSHQLASNIGHQLREVRALAEELLRAGQQLAA